MEGGGAPFGNAIEYGDPPSTMAELQSFINPVLQRGSMRSRAVTEEGDPSPKGSEYKG
jgi:hypothetical protein